LNVREFQANVIEYCKFQQPFIKNFISVEKTAGRK